MPFRERNGIAGFDRRVDAAILLGLERHGLRPRGRSSSTRSRSPSSSGRSVPAGVFDARRLSVGTMPWSSSSIWPSRFALYSLIAAIAMRRTRPSLARLRLAWIEVRLDSRPHWHELRRRFATWAHRVKGVPLALVQEWCGHRDMRTTLGYLRIDGTDVPEGVGNFTVLDSNGHEAAASRLVLDTGRDNRDAAMAASDSVA